jgi:mono/diheme cytochrome c family protein
MRTYLILATGALLCASTAMGQQPDGRKIFEGKGNCAVCHGKDARGTLLAPDLTDAEWLNIDGTEPAIATVVTKGVAKPVSHPAPMPAMGGVKLSPEEIAAVAAYVSGLRRRSGG